MQQQKNNLSIDHIIIAWLTETILQNSPQWPGQADTEIEKKIWQAGMEHGVLALCSYKLHSIAAENSLSGSLRERLKSIERQAAITELLREKEIKDILARLAAEDIQPLLLKGTPLAYSLYPAPYLRPRCDTDFFFTDNGVAEQAWNMVREMGYRRPHAVSGKFVSHEFSCFRTGPAGLSHCLDFHWKLSNNQTYARIFSFDELMDASVQVPVLDNVHTLNNVHALLYACMHRMSHKGDNTADRLIWFYDIHMLAQSLSATDWQQLTSIAKEKKNLRHDTLRFNGNCRRVWIKYPGNCNG